MSEAERAAQTAAPVATGEPAPVATGESEVPGRDIEGEEEEPHEMDTAVDVT